MLKILKNVGFLHAREEKTQKHRFSSHTMRRETPETQNWTVTIIVSIIEVYSVNFTLTGYKAGF